MSAVPERIGILMGRQGGFSSLNLPAPLEVNPKPSLSFVPLSSAWEVGFAGLGDPATVNAYYTYNGINSTPSTPSSGLISLGEDSGGKYLIAKDPSPRAGWFMSTMQIQDSRVNDVTSGDFKINAQVRLAGFVESPGNQNSGTGTVGLYTASLGHYLTITFSSRNNSGGSGTSSFARLSLSWRSTGGADAGSYLDYDLTEEDTDVFFREWTDIEIQNTNAGLAVTVGAATAVLASGNKVEISNLTRLLVMQKTGDFTFNPIDAHIRNLVITAL
jgi:hypothetical protein